MGLQRTKRVCNGYSWSLMDNSGSVQDIVGFLWIEWICNGCSGPVMYIVCLLWIKWVCNGYSGSVMV